MKVVLDPARVSRGLTRVAGEIVERHRGVNGLVLIGVRRGGVPVAKALRDCLAQLEPGPVELGSVDITLYRDDASSALPNPKIGPSKIPVSIDGRPVILVDDVVHTGRTIRAALDAILDFGRPRSIELAAVVDRGGRELPIQPDYCVEQIRVGADEKVDVVVEGDAIAAVVQAVGRPSLLPVSVAQLLAGEEPE